jgi:putative sterol carrier protein
MFLFGIGALKVIGFQVDIDSLISYLVDKSQISQERRKCIMTPKTVFEEDLPKKLKEKGDAVTKTNAVFQFNLTGDDGGSWWIDTTKSGGETGAGKNENAKCIVTMAAGDFIDMVTGKLNGQMAFMTGKLKLEGDMMLAMQLGSVLGV